MALGVYGGILAECKPTPEETASIFEYLASTRIKDLKVVENPLETYDFPETFVAKSLFTHIVSLHADFEQLRNDSPEAKRATLNRPRKKG